MSFDYTEHPHRRWNPLKGSWVLCSPHRAKRPWQGQQEKPQPDDRPEYDPDDYLGPGNYRSGGKEQNPDYKDTFVFDNDFMALLPDTPEGHVGSVDNGDLFVARSVKGRCRVVCFCPRLNVTVAEMNNEMVRKVVDAWVEQYKMLSEQPYIGHVQIFENKGQMMGASNPHPHGQIWASEFVPEEPTREFENQRKYMERFGVSMLERYVEQELEQRERVICENDTFVAVVPFWALWPFEAMIIPKKRVGSVLEMDDRLKDDFADMYRRVTCRYDNLFLTSFPYSMGIRQAPVDGKDYSYVHLYMTFYPPLLRSASVRKFMVGFELLCEGQRDLTAEQAADRLRKLSEVHFRQQGGEQDEEKEEKKE